MDSIYLDLTHTSHTRAQTGIQIVCRSLYRHLNDTYEVNAVVWDRYHKVWRLVDKRELENLVLPDSETPPKSRGSRWLFSQKARGTLSRIAGKAGLNTKDCLLLAPELFDKVRDAGYSKWHGPKVGLFHDAIPLRHPEWTPSEMIARYPDYLKELAKFNAVACVSQSALTDLLQAWQAQKTAPVPQTKVTRLGLPEGRRNLTTQIKVDTSNLCRSILFVGTLERRKNHLAFLQACELLWNEGIAFSLHLAGMINRETGHAAQAKIAQLTSEGKSIFWHGAVSELKLHELYSNTDLVAYPSLYEGYGLPVLEAMAYGKPVLCGNGGALSEFAELGGCISIEPTTANLKETLFSLITNQDKFLELQSQLPDKNSLPSMDDFAESFYSWAKSFA